MKIFLPRDIQLSSVAELKLIIVGYKDIKNFIFQQLIKKLWLGEDNDERTNNP